MRLAAWRATLLALLSAVSLAGQAADVGPVTPIDAPGLATEIEARAGKVLLVNFWATWCRPCLEEIPALMALEDEFGEQGFELVAVSLDEPASADGVVVPFLARWFPDFTTWLSSERSMDDMVSVIDPAWNEVLPTSYIIGRDGSVVRRVQGGSSAEEFGAAVREAL